MPIQPLQGAYYIRPDFIAKYWDGVSKELRASLWRVHREIDGLPNEECSVGALWARFTDEEKRQINRVIEWKEEQLKEAMRQRR